MLLGERDCSARRAALFIACSLFLIIRVGALSASSASDGSSPTSVRQISRSAGESALRQVQWLGSRVAQKEDSFEQARCDSKVDGLGGAVISNSKRQLLDAAPGKPAQANTKERQVWEALASLEQDSTY